MTEGQIQDQFSEWLKARRIPYIGFRRDKPTTTRKGVQDFTCFLPGGKTLCVEMKDAKGKRSPEQEKWAEEMAAMGHHVFLFRSLAECVEQVEKDSPLSRFVIFGDGVWAEYRGQLRHVRKAQPGDEKLYPRI